MFHWQILNLTIAFPCGYPAPDYRMCLYRCLLSFPFLWEARFIAGLRLVESGERIAKDITFPFRASCTHVTHTMLAGRTTAIWGFGGGGRDSNPSGATAYKLPPPPKPCI